MPDEAWNQSKVIRPLALAAVMTTPAPMRFWVQVLPVRLSRQASAPSAVWRVTERKRLAVVRRSARSPEPRMAARFPTFLMAKESNQTVAGPCPMRRGTMAATPGGMMKRDFRGCHIAAAPAVRAP